jgi:hypothetical protein
VKHKDGLQEPLALDRFDEEVVALGFHVVGVVSAPANRRCSECNPLL